MFEKERQERRLLAYFGSFDSAYFTRAVPLNFSVKLDQKRSEKIF